MAYQVSYTTDAYPTDVPEGAKVEKTSDLPVDFTTRFSGRRIHLFKDSALDEMFISVMGGPNTRLDRDEVRTLANGLLEALGETVAPPLPIAVIDKAGDRWNQDEPGKDAYTYVQVFTEFHESKTLSEIERNYGIIRRINA